MRTMLVYVLNACLLAAVVPEVLGVPHCCVSKRFYGEVKVTRGTAVAGTTKAFTSVNSLFIEFDADLQLELLNGTFHEDENGTTTAYTVWNDFANDRTFKKTNGGKCEMGVLTEDITPFCVPSELQYEGSAYFGSGDEVVHINSWSGISATDGLHYSSQTSDSDCTPVSLTRFGRDKQGNVIVEETNYYNIKQYGHSGAHAFDIPMECVQLIHGR